MTDIDRVRSSDETDGVDFHFGLNFEFDIGFGSLIIDN